MLAAPCRAASQVQPALLPLRFSVPGKTGAPRCCRRPPLLPPPRRCRVQVAATSAVPLSTTAVRFSISLPEEELANLAAANLAASGHDDLAMLQIQWSRCCAGAGGGGRGCSCSCSAAVLLAAWAAGRGPRSSSRPGCGAGSSTAPAWWGVAAAGPSHKGAIESAPAAPLPPLQE